MRRRFDDEFKREAIRLVKTSNKKITEIARELGIAKSTLHEWLVKSVEMPNGYIMTNSEITRLKRELAHVKTERDILKKAVAIFSVPSK
jgi:transposase